MAGDMYYLVECFYKMKTGYKLNLKKKKNSEECRTRIDISIIWLFVEFR